ncbi:MAG: SDR family oxidoreductase [Alphaproteobacteria bacterium]|nr:MAG: SDR family oxidoreductase [Alphaproteobacteria bacterium]
MTDQAAHADYDDVFSDWDGANAPTYPDLAGKAVFITGGGSGIGAYMTAAFAQQGAKVAFVSLTREPAEKLCESVAARGYQKPLFIQCDIRDVDALKAAVVAAEAAHGPASVLVNNAARDTRHTVTDLSVEAWDDMMNTNLRPHFFAVQAVAEGMKKLGGGSIVNLGSNSANLGLAGYPAYVSAKAAIVGMTKALARELGENAITVNALIPGWVMTARQKRLWVTEEALQQCLAEQAIKSTIGGWDIAAFALFLASRASGMMTGQQVIVDGGRV